MSNTRYVKCNNILFCLNFKVCSTTFAVAIGKKLYDKNIGHMALEYTTDPSKRTICLFRNPIDRFFSSMSQIALKDVDDVLTTLENDRPRTVIRNQQLDPQRIHPHHLKIPKDHPGYEQITRNRNNPKPISILFDDMHFLPQCRFQGHPIEYYRYPDQIETVCKILDLEYPLPRHNERKQNNLSLVATDEQKNRIAKLYKRDMMIWDKIEENNGVFIVNNYYPILS